jgi:hypothetical protein
MQRYLSNVAIAAEACWALRNLAVDANLLQRLNVADVGGMMCNILYRHADSDLVTIEALRVVETLCTGGKPVFQTNSDRGEAEIAKKAAAQNLPICTRIHVGLLRSFSKVLSRNSGKIEVMLWIFKVVVAICISDAIIAKFVEAKFCEMALDFLQRHSGMYFG